MPGALEDTPGGHSPFALVGAGALGTALALGWQRAGYRIATVISRNEASAERLTVRMGAGTPTTDVQALDPAVRLVACCVPDDAIGRVAEQLASRAHPWHQTLVLHSSGVHTAAALAPLADWGARTLSFHPLQTFVPPVSPDLFHGIYVSLQGAPEAVAAGRRLAADLGARAVELTAEAKVRYHLAASLASNAFVTVQGLVGEVLGSIGIDGATGSAMMAPLVAATWANLQRGLPEDVLTGPVARGDVATIWQHLDALQQHLPHLLPVYAALVNETVRLAVRGGTLAPPAAETILERVHAALHPPERG